MVPSKHSVALLFTVFTHQPPHMGYLHFLVSLRMLKNDFSIFGLFDLDFDLLLFFGFDLDFDLLLFFGFDLDFGLLLFFGFLSSAGRGR
mmetsp:Transcript_22467/g.45479  ORF Transcript_22467/g.45479 Transcript_22467/m.45479 type:complete len:89 (+) Transcript_22467:258-524(+)